MFAKDDAFLEIMIIAILTFSLFPVTQDIVHFKSLFSSF